MDLHTAKIGTGIVDLATDTRMRNSGTGSRPSAHVDPSRVAFIRSGRLYQSDLRCASHQARSLSVAALRAASEAV